MVEEMASVRLGSDGAELTLRHDLTAETQDGVDEDIGVLDAGGLAPAPSKRCAAGGIWKPAAVSRTSISGKEVRT